MNRVKGLRLVIYYFLQATWGIIQNTIGLITFIILMIKNPGRNRYFFNGALVSEWKFTFSTGCGMFIFFGHKKAKDADKVLVHEYGHTIQSCILGPLFLPVIALPSVIWAFAPCFVKMRKKKKIRYGSFYPESWANSIGSKVTGLPSPDR